MQPLPPVSAPPYTSSSDSPAPEPHQPSLENLLLRFGLVTLDQLGAAMREQAVTGTPFQDILVRDGAIRADELARVVERAPAMPAAFEPEPPVLAEAPVPDDPPATAEPEPEPEPVLPPAALDPEPEPQPQPDFSPVAVLPEPEPEPGPDPVAVPVVVGYTVRGHLVNGEEIEIATVEDAAAAQRIARDAMRACARPDTADWPVLSGRYVRPDAIVSIEVAETLA